MYNWSVIHGIKRKPHLSVVWNWYHFVAIAILHQPRPTDSADINTRLQLSDTSSIPPMHGGFLLLPLSKYYNTRMWNLCSNKSVIGHYLVSETFTWLLRQRQCFNPYFRWSICQGAVLSGLHSLDLCMSLNKIVGYTWSNSECVDKIIMQKIDWKFYYHRSWLPQVDECVKYQESFDYIVQAEARYSLFLRLLELKLIHASKRFPGEIQMVLTPICFKTLYKGRPG